MDSNTFTALVAIASTLLGGLVAWVSQYYSSKKQDERRFKHEVEKKQELDHKRMVATYRRLWGIADRIVSRQVTETVKWITSEEYEMIESIIVQNFDVLDASTVAAWDTKNIVETLIRSAGGVNFRVQCEAFWPDVKKHYDKYKYNAIPPSEATA